MVVALGRKWHRAQSFGHGEEFGDRNAEVGKKLRIADLGKG